MRNHGTRLLTMRRKSQNNIEMRRKLVDTRATNRRKIDSDRLLRFGAADTPVYLIHRVTGMPFNVELGVPRFPAPQLHLEMDMRRFAARIRNRLDGAEIIFTGRASEKSSETLKIRVISSLRRTP